MLVKGHSSVADSQRNSFDLRLQLFTAMALSLGYGTAQGILTHSMLISTYGQLSVFWAFIEACLVVFFYVPSHVMTGNLIGLQLGRRNVLNENLPLPVILSWPILFRTACLYQYLILSMRDFFWSWIVILISLLVAFGSYIRHVQKKLPEDYLDAAGFNALLGYVQLQD